MEELLFEETFDKLQDSWIIDDSFQPKEIKCNEKCLKYLVPLFLNEDISSHNGNGVIVGNYLITAAHVARSKDKKNNYSKLYYVYEGNLKEVGDEQVIHDGRGYSDTDKIHDDLIIYKLDASYNSFRFYDEKLADVRFCSKVFDYDEGKNKIISTPIETIYNRPNSKWNNCFDVRLGYDKYICGNSGCALFIQDVLYGIFIKIKGNKCTSVQEIIEIENFIILDAKYIKECIDKYELSINKEII